MNEGFPINNFLRLSAMGQSAGYRPQNPEFPETGMMMTPDMLNARLGAQMGGFRAGMTGVLVRLPNGQYMRMPMGDVGYSRPFMGGDLGVNATIDPMQNYNVNFLYNRRF
jgi:hypothetical protein